METEYVGCLFLQFEKTPAPGLFFEGHSDWDGGGKTFGSEKKEIDSQWRRRSMLTSRTDLCAASRHNKG